MAWPVHVTVVRDMVESMPDSLQEVIQKGGNTTHH